MNKNVEVWKHRAPSYNNINWTSDSEQLEILKTVIDPSPSDEVLDFGCGTGIVSNFISDYVNSVFAVDTSREMLKQFVTEKKNIDDQHIYSIHGLDPQEYNQRFDTIISRMVFHHVENRCEHFRILHNFLKKNGTLVIQENGISANPNVNSWFHSMMLHKEHRYYMSEEALVFDLYSSGFKMVETFRYLSRNFSVRNWLENTEKDRKKIEFIFELHNNMPDEIKSAYNWRRTCNDILLDTEMLFVFGFGSTNLTDQCN